MKKLILAIVFLLVAGNANALLVDVFATGNMRERIDLCGYGCGYTSIPASTGIVNTLGLAYAGGPVANNSVGYAQQFSLDQETRIDYLLASAHIYSDTYYNQTEANSNTMYFKLYTGESTTYHGEPSAPYPDVNTAAIVSSLFVSTYFEREYLPEYDYWHISDTERYYVDEYVPFGITLQPGSYWIAQERYPGNDWITGLNQSKVGEISVRFGQNDLVLPHTPEPSTFLLFGLGLLGVFVRRRKRV